MTAHSHFERSSQTAPRHPRSRRSLPTLAAFVLASCAILGVATPSAAVGPLKAATPSPSPSVNAQPALDVSVVAGAQGAVAEKQNVPIAVKLTNTDSAAVSASTVMLSVGSEPLPTRDRLHEWLNKGDNVAQFNDAGTIELASANPGQHREGSTEISAGSAIGKSLRPGTYPILAVHLADGHRTEVRSVVTVVAAGTSRPVGVVLPLTATTAASGLLTADELSGLTASNGELRTTLDAASSSDILAIDPAIIAAIRSLGSSAPASAAKWLNDVESAPNPRFPLEFADADVAMQYDSGRDTLLSPLNLDAYLRPSDFKGNDLAASPAPTAASKLPSLQDLLKIPVTVDTLSWPASGTVSQAVASRDATSTLLVSSAQVPAATGAHVAAEGRSLLAYDADASNALKAASTVADEADRGMKTASLLAETSFASTSAQGAPILVALDRPDKTDPAALKSTLQALRSAGNVPTNLSQIRAVAPQPVALTYAAPDPALTTQFNQLLADEQKTADFSTVAVQPDLLKGRERAVLLQSIRTEAVRGGNWPAAYAAQRDRTTTVLDAVRIQGTSELMIAGTGVDIPISVRNNLPFPVKVQLHSEPTDLRLRVQETTVVEIGAESSVRARVPVTALVSNGESGLELSLRAMNDMPLGPVETLKITVRAEWETIGLWLIGGLGGLLLIVGTIRTIRKRRRGDSSDDRKAARAAYRASSSRKDTAESADNADSAEPADTAENESKTDG